MARSRVGVKTGPIGLDFKLDHYPLTIWNLFGHRRTLGAPTRPARPAPTIVFRQTDGVASPARVTLQGLIEDDASATGLGISVTNALLVRVQ